MKKIPSSDTQSIHDRNQNQYWQTSSPDFCHHGRTSHKIQDSNVLWVLHVHRWSFGQKRPICEPTHFAYSEPAKRSHTLLIIQEINTYIILKKTFTLPAGHLFQRDLELLLFVDSNPGRAQVNPSGTVQKVHPVPRTISKKNNCLIIIAVFHF